MFLLISILKGGKLTKRRIGRPSEMNTQALVSFGHMHISDL